MTSRAGGHILSGDLIRVLLLEEDPVDAELVQKSLSYSSAK